ncbi:MAG TPA: hypothetical protein VH020_09300 [Stellaceae bacterium]|jgi:hypothetical protein|nr:hypothetical protein [Stellaceae bacterium]
MTLSKSPDTASTGMGASEAKHTPTPWLRAGLTIYALHPTGDYWGHGADYRPVLINRFDLHVQGGYTGRSRTPDAEIDANAEFIDRTVNCHDELVEALADARSVLMMQDRSAAWRQERDRVMGRAAEVLAKATTT